jgi:hypothetical protein
MAGLGHAVDRGSHFVTLASEGRACSPMRGGTVTGREGRVAKPLVAGTMTEIDLGPEVPMLRSPQDQPDRILEKQPQQHRQHLADHVETESAARDPAELEKRRARFRMQILTLIQEAAERANHDLTTGAEEYRLCDVSGYFTGPLYSGGAVCNPIAYELWVNGQALGETLFVELTHGGLVEASLGPFRPAIHEAHRSRVHFGWYPMPLFQFDKEAASELMFRYRAAVRTRWPLHRDRSSGFRNQEA